MRGSDVMALNPGTKLDPYEILGLIRFRRRFS